MGVRTLEDKEDGYKCLYCSTAMWAFGPIFYADEDVEEFLEWLKIDPRKLTDKELEDKVYEWRKDNEKCQHEGEQKNGICLECGEETP